MLEISNAVSLGDWEIELSAIRSQGNGGQRVNKVATAIHLRFDINSSSLPASYKERLLKLKDSRITADGIIIIKAQSFRTQEQNKDNALKRLKEIIVAAMVIQRVRRVTKPTRSSQRKRIDNKKQRSNTKALRGKVT
jgi:ribosome-associated protein|tara:strand:+ start:2035 stop:2445 length:411 start_codon:yes stop_codon:yes gene_type:complete